jgi:hypothetical protein
MVKVKPLGQSQKNFEDSAGKAGTNYAAAIDGISWQAEAVAGQALYEQKMQDPSVLARRSRGIQNVSDAEFKQALREKGAGRIAGGIRASGGKWAAKFSPYHSALQGVSLPPRSADPMQNVDNRVKPIVRAMVDTKEAQG